MVVAIDDAVVYDQGVTPGPCGRDVTIVIRGLGEQYSGTEFSGTTSGMMRFTVSGGLE